MTTPAPDHATHDALLIASHLDGTLDAREATLVHEWLATCEPCVELRADLVAIAAATRTMAMPTRPRDFTLTAADAERARGRGWRRVLAAIASPRDRVTRPLAVGLTTLGLAGLLLANIPTASLFGGAASAGAPSDGATSSQVEMNGVDAGAGAAASAPVGAAPLVPNAAATSDGYGQVAPESSPIRDTAGGESGKGTDKVTGGDHLGATPPAATGPSILIAASILMLAAGVALALLRWGARRLGDG